jgi:hypothetical protein
MTALAARSSVDHPDALGSRNNLAYAYTHSRRDPGPRHTEEQRGSGVLFACYQVRQGQRG